MGKKLSQKEQNAILASVKIAFCIQSKKTDNGIVEPIKKKFLSLRWDVNKNFNIF